MLSNMTSSATEEAPVKIFFGTKPELGDRTELDKWMEMINEENDADK